MDLLTAATTWSRRVGRERVEIVLDPALLPRLLGVRRPLPKPPAYSADAVDLARRVGAALGLLVQPGDRSALLHEGLGPRLLAAPGPALRVPERHAEWVRRRAVRMRDGLLSAGYAVHGDPDALVPLPEPGSGSDVSGPDDVGVLALALRLLVEKGVR